MAIWVLQHLPDPMVERLHLELIDPSKDDWNFGAMAGADVAAGHINILTGGFSAYWDVMDVYHSHYGTPVLYLQNRLGNQRLFALMDDYNAVSESAVARTWGDDHLEHAHVIARKWEAAKAARQRGRIAATLTSPAGARIVLVGGIDFNGDGKVKPNDEAALRGALDGAVFVEAIDEFTDLVILATSGEAPEQPDDPLDPIQQQHYQRIQRAYEGVNVRNAEHSDQAARLRIDVADPDLVREVLSP